MSKDIYQSETYEHKNGLKYHVCWYIDHDSQSPLEWSDCHGVTERMDWSSVLLCGSERLLLSQRSAFL